MTDFRNAKQKAGERLGLADSGALPSNLEVDAALAERQRIFDADEQPQRLTECRQAAVRLMHDLAAFSPRLVGAVLSGHASEHDTVDLHVFCDEIEAVGAALDALGIANRLAQHRLRLRRGEFGVFPAYRLHRDDCEFDITVFPERGRGNAPLSAIDGRPMRRATARDVEALIAAGS